MSINKVYIAIGSVSLIAIGYFIYNKSKTNKTTTPPGNNNDSLTNVANNLPTEPIKPIVPIQNITPSVPQTIGAPLNQTIWLKGNNGQYVSSENGTTFMYCNRAKVLGSEMFLVSPGWAGKITIRNGGKYVSSENGTQPIACNRTVADGWEQFEWINNNDGTISLRYNGAYVSSKNGTEAMTCDSTSIGTAEKFTYGAASMSNDSVSFVGKVF